MHAAAVSGHVRDQVVVEISKRVPQMVVLRGAFGPAGAAKPKPVMTSA
jgi:hypothetical protein